MSSFLRLERKQKIFQMHSELAYFYFFVLIHLELERQIRLYTSVVPSKIIPVFRPNRNKKAKRLTSAAAQTHMAYIGKYPSPAPLLGNCVTKITIMVQMSCFTLYSSIETASCHLLQQIARMKMVWNLDNFFHAFKCQQKKNTVVFSFVRYRLPNSAQAFQIYMRKGTKACFKRRATTVLSWFDCSSTAARHQHDLVSDVEFNSVE